MCRHCGGQIKDHGRHRKKMNPAGVNLTDIGTDFSPVRHKPRKHRKANALPEKFLQRLLTISSETGDIALDPSGESDTTYTFAEKMHRHWLG